MSWGKLVAAKIAEVQRLHEEPPISDVPEPSPVAEPLRPTVVISAPATDDDAEERAAIQQFDSSTASVDPIWTAFRQRNGTGPAGDDLPAWRRWMGRIYHNRVASGRSPHDAHRLTLGEAECVWHERYGAVPDRDHCAGCGVLMIDHPGSPLPDGARVHLDEVHGVECLIAYGDRWRGAARAALEAMGIKGFEKSV
jgi:hypothetical protein